MQINPPARRRQREFRARLVSAAYHGGGRRFRKPAFRGNPITRPRTFAPPSGKGISVRKRRTPRAVAARPSEGCALERPDGLGLDASELHQADPADCACQAIANHRPADRLKFVSSRTRSWGPAARSRSVSTPEETSESSNARRNALLLRRADDNQRLPVDAIGLEHRVVERRAGPGDSGHRSGGGRAHISPPCPPRAEPAPA